MEVESEEPKVQVPRTEATEYVLSLSPGDSEVKNKLEDLLEICDTKTESPDTANWSCRAKN